MEKSINTSEWCYQVAWNSIHDAMELIVKTKQLMIETKKPNNQVNQKLYENLVDASTLLNGCTQIISAMTTEEDNE